MILSKQLETAGNWLFRYRGILPVPVLASSYIYFIFNKINLGGVYLMTAFCVCLIGFLIRAYTVGYAAEGTSGRNTAGQAAESLNTTGIYSVVRNPLYLGNFFMWGGVAMFTKNPLFILAFCLAFWLYYERIIYAEEQFLIKKFGNTFTDWASRTPAFIPKPGLFKKPATAFNLKKVLKKEKSGLLAVSIVFLLFDTTGRILSGSPDSVNPYLLALFAMSLAIYTVLKLFKLTRKG